MIKVVIVEDEFLAYSELKSMLKKIRPHFEVVQHLESIVSLSTFFKEEKAIDLIFLDIELQDGNSLEKIKVLQLKTPIIFCTAYPQFALDAFDTNAIGYLLKPFSKEKLLHVIEKFESINPTFKIKSENENSLIINSEYKTIKIAFEDILFIESLDDYIKIHVQGQKTHATLMSMKKMLEKLPDDKFVRVHRSYILPLFRIEYVKGKIISLGFKEFPLGITHETAFYKKYLKENY
jgi:DNA-binding LytR/AlgR family response regulator